MKSPTCAHLESLQWPITKWDTPHSDTVSTEVIIQIIWSPKRYEQKHQIAEATEGTFNLNLEYVHNHHT